MMLALHKFNEVFDHIQPHEYKGLLSPKLRKDVLSSDNIEIALYGIFP